MSIKERFKIVDGRYYGLTAEEYCLCILDSLTNRLYSFNETLEHDLVGIANLTADDSVVCDGNYIQLQYKLI